jgi:NADH:ubiquinone oxidoreductase subunit E
MPFSEETLTRLKADAAEITGRYPRARSALLPLLYLVQAEEGYVSDEGMAFCAEVLGITQTEVRGVATFYTMYKLEPAAEYQVGVCINTTCAIMGGDQIWSELAEHLGADPHNDGHSAANHGDIKSPDGKVAIERLECNAACDYAPVVMVNWEFFDNQTPQSALHSRRSTATLPSGDLMSWCPSACAAASSPPTCAASSAQIWSPPMIAQVVLMQTPTWYSAAGSRLYIV